MLTNKIKRNQERDQQNYQVLHDNGWQVIVIWECQLTPKLMEETMLGSVSTSVSEVC